MEHIIAEKHDGETVSENLALACAICNRHKGSDLTSIDLETRKVTALFHPRQDDWAAHLRLGEDGVISGLDAKGRVTARLLRMNDPSRVEVRQILLEVGEYETP